MERKKRVAVVGAGASGIVAAIMAARGGAEVILIEHKDRVGKKILSTGNGKCNYTNDYMTTDCFRGEDLSTVSKVLKEFGTKETLDFFYELGILPKSRQGYYYPKSEQATAILDVLRMELERLNVQVLCDTHVSSIKKKKDFMLQTASKRLNADCVILATGGKASSVLGSDGSGYDLAKSMGHSIAPVVPALVQLHAKGDFFKQVSGVRTEAKVSVKIDGKIVAEDTGELQLTNYGVSGIPVFQISRYASEALYKKKKPFVVLDFMPDMTKEELEDFLAMRIEKNPKKTAEELLVGIFNKKLIPVFLKKASISLKTYAYKLNSKEFISLINVLKSFELEIIKTNPFEQAQICAGGVRTEELYIPSMESKYVPGLYITGELLDVDGICGGYNLQWAWATGYLAGSNSVKG